MPTCGIYLIKHRATGRCYIGLSKDIGRRWTGHRRKLRSEEWDKLNGAHIAMWYDRGDMSVEEAFEFSILTECQPDQLSHFERVWFDAYKAEGIELYNVEHAIGFCAGGRKGNTVHQVKTYKLPLTQRTKMSLNCASKRLEVRAKLRAAANGPRAVRNLGTGQVFRTVAEATAHYGFGRGRLRASIIKNKPLAGHLFAYIE